VALAARARAAIFLPVFPLAPIPCFCYNQPVQSCGWASQKKLQLACPFLAFEKWDGWVNRPCLVGRIAVERKVHVSVNGVPVEKVIDEALRAEYRSLHQAEVSSMAFIAAMSKSNATARARNHSGARSGRGRVIFSALIR